VLFSGAKILTFLFPTIPSIHFFLFGLRFFDIQTSEVALPYKDACASQATLLRVKKPSKQWVKFKMGVLLNLI